jgi:ATP-dependent DNA helicase RecG
MVHFPEADSDFDLLKIHATEGHRRLVFEELFLLMMGVAVRRRQQAGEKGIAFKCESAQMKKLADLLPFELTADQKSAVNQIVVDMRKPVPMHRLLQGDVGCGKTVVALFAAAAAIADGYQVALMAPTEVLAEQHFKTLSEYAEKVGFTIGLLTGNRTAEDAKVVRDGLQSGDIQFVIGTHALIQETTQFAKLGLAIVDEQHRFGVGQRRLLVGKGGAVDLLTMTATPIPRSLAMTAYGDMDLSLILEKPKDRKPVITTIIPGDQRDKAYELLLARLQKGGQGFVVLPVIKANGDREIYAATTEAERLAEKFTDLRVGLAHGKMKPAEKTAMFKAFADGELDLLVATTVIEVGMDIPNATAMVIEHAERFGLAQLHQLRGRVGRSDQQGECIMIAHDTESDAAGQRLAVLEKVHDGMELAEKDLELRGQGDLLGSRQHGLPSLRLADLTRDLKMLEIAKTEATELLKKDPKLDSSEDMVGTREGLERWWGREFSKGLMD